MLKIRKSSIVVALGTLMLFRPPIIMQYTILDRLVSLSVNAISALVLVQWLLAKMKVDKWIIQTGVFFATLIVVTVANGGEMTYVFSAIKIFAAVLIWNGMIKKSPDHFLLVVKNTLFFLVLLNLASMILFPNGLVQIQRVENEWNEYSVGWWIFGNKNTMIMWIFSLNILAQNSLYLKKKYHKTYYKDVWMIGATILTAFLSKSSTTIIAIVLISSLPYIYSFFESQCRKEILSPNVILASYIIFTVILITSTQLELFKIVADIFDKDVTFTGRTSAWAQAMVLIAKKPWFGYGMLNEQTFKNLLGAYAFVNAHNTLLQSIIEGGIVLGVQYLMTYYLLCKKIKRISDEYLRQKALLLMSMIVLGIAMSFEAYTDSLLFWNMFTLIYYTVEFIQGEHYYEKNV